MKSNFGETDMRQAVIAARDRKHFSNLEQVLGKHNFAIEWAGSGKAVLELCRTQKKIDLLVVDQALEDMKTKEVVEKAIMINPMINCVPVSSLAHKDFHDFFEGLGVLAQLPPEPGLQDAEDMLSAVKKVLDLTA